MRDTFASKRIEFINKLNNVFIVENMHLAKCRFVNIMLMNLINMQYLYLKYKRLA